jgi:hypothetical protein
MAIKRARRFWRPDSVGIRRPENGTADAYLILAVTCAILPFARRGFFGKRLVSLSITHKIAFYLRVL